MHFPSIAPRVRRRVAAALPVAAAALVFAPLASAATTQPVIYTPTDTPSLQSDISSADSAAPGTLSVIQLTNTTYQPTQELPLSGNIEIEGPPTVQAAQGVTPDTQVNGQNVFTISPAVPLFFVNPGANVLFKGFDIDTAGNGQGIGAIQDFGGNVEVLNMGIIGSTGSGIVLENGGSLTMINSNLGSGVDDGIEQNGNGTVTLINDTFSFNGLGAIEGPNITADNTLFYKNAQGGGTGACGQLGTTGDTFAGDYNNDTTCGTTGVTVPTGTAATAYNKDIALTGFYGGPTQTNQLKTGNPAIGKGLPQFCQTDDQRFFLYTQGSGGTCDVGSYQTTGTQDTSVTGPSCSVAPNGIFESTNPAVPSTEMVDTTEPGGIGLGPDSVLTTTTTNGTVSVATVAGTWFESASPGQPLVVTATKPVGDLTVGDTNWSFYATDLLGNTTFCN